MKTLEEKIPKDIIKVAKKFSIINYQEKYGEDCGTENIAKGEIEKFNFVKGQKYDFVGEGRWIRLPDGSSEWYIPRIYNPVGEKVNKITRDKNWNEYSTIWVHLGKDFFKQISKVLDNRTC